MSTQSFQRSFTASLLSPNSHTALSSSSTATTASTSNMSLSPDMAFFGKKSAPPPVRLGSLERQQRPVSEILKPESFISPETQVLDKWFEDLQEYENSLESMATASLDPKYKEEVQHVDQWFRYLNEAERTSTIYTLLQHSTQVQIRFFIAVLQQMDKKDSLLSPAHPEKVDMQAQITGAMKKAELEASQKLLSVLPYQTGQVIARPNANAIRRNHIDRHSFALGDTQEYDHLFSRMPSDRTRNTSFGIDGGGGGVLQHSRGVFDPPSSSTNNRPKSVIEGGDISSIFGSDWSYGGLGSSQQRLRQNNTVGSNRPKSADISNWSFGITSSVSSSKSTIQESNDPWSGFSPKVSTFAEQQQQSSTDIDLATMASNWSLNNDTPKGSSTNRPTVILNDDIKGFRNQTMHMPRTDEHPQMTTAPSNPTNIVLSLYDEHHQSAPISSTHLLGTTDKASSNGNNPYYTMQAHHHSRPNSRSASPIPSRTNSKNSFSGNNNNNSRGKNHTFGQFLNPNDRVNDSENGYFSDHSDASHRSATKRNMMKIDPAVIHHQQHGHHHQQGDSISGNKNNSPTGRENKKNIDIVDMKLLEDVPAWLRSLRLHKYNPIFESMKWQDMLKMDDSALLNRGVTALGARRKLLKVFDQVKAHCETHNITY